MAQWKIEEQEGGGVVATVYKTQARIDWIGAWHSNRPEALAWIVKHLEFSPFERPTAAEIEAARKASSPTPLDVAEVELALAERQHAAGTLRIEYVEDAAALVAELTEAERRTA